MSVPVEIELDRGEFSAIPFSITDVNNGLLTKRVTFSVRKRTTGEQVLRKQSALPGSSADVTISQQLAGSIVGFINILKADYDAMPASQYIATVWTDSGTDDDVCVTEGGHYDLVINKTAAR